MVVKPLPDTDYLLECFEVVKRPLFPVESPLLQIHFKSAWHMKIHHTRFVGKEAGTISKAGYREVKINGNTYKSHRILWKIANGFEPDMIDHIDGNRLNNRHDNLRLATKQENGANRGLSCNNKSGYKGVAWHTRDMCWDAYITVDGKRIALGRSENLLDAVSCRVAAEEKYQKEYRRKP